MNMSVIAGQPPPASIFKLNFDAAIFSNLNSSGFGAMIQNEKREVMAAMSAMGPSVGDNKEAVIIRF